MPKIASLIFAVFALAAMAVVGSVASAAPAGAATKLSIASQTCKPNGTVDAMLRWTPSGLGSQFVELATNADFSKRSTGGPYSSNADAVGLTQLKQGATYYARVLTSSGGGTLVSDAIAVTARSCVAGDSITSPTNLDATALADGRVQLDWAPGNNNIWYCVDTAPSLNALFNLGSGWRNHGCWNTSSNLTISGLSCGSTVYWLVYTWNATDSVKSDAEVFQTRSCAATISPPTSLDADIVEGGVLFDWAPGAGNTWYCVDTAPTQNALLNFGSGWRNHGCWNTSSQLFVSGLDCGQTYYWLVYAWNPVANTKSAVSTVQTQACKATLELAPIVDVEVVQAGESYRADIIAALPNGCHEPDSHRVQRFGDTIEITVWNKVEPGQCTQVYGEYELNVNLGDDFESGETYEVIVNDDESDEFIAD
jgi:hypothetical protein